MKIFVICKEINKDVYNYYKDYDDLYFVTRKNKMEKCIDEDYYLNKNEFIQKLESKKISRPAWYYQQFLKYKIIEKEECKTIHIIDGDSIISEKLIKSEVLYYNNNSSNIEYNNFYSEIFKINTKNKYCFVTNQMCFNKYNFIKMCKSISSEGDYVEEILNKIKDKCKFSEYQTYANFCIDNNLTDSTKEIRVFRRMDLINDDLDSAIKKYDLISFEPHHRTGFLRVIRAKLFYLLSKTIS